MSLTETPICNFGEKAKNFNLLSTDNKKIAQISKKYGAKVPFLREKKYAQDLTTTEATLQNALNVYEKQNSVKFDICVYIVYKFLFNIFWRDPPFEMYTRAINGSASS